MPSLSRMLDRAIKNYNRYRTHLATARLLESGEGYIVVQFEGPFSRACCMDEYFHDLTYELKDVGLKATPTQVREVGHEKFVVRYSIES